MATLSVSNVALIGCTSFSGKALKPVFVGKALKL
jgi:hypothetical protein